MDLVYEAGMRNRKLRILITRLRFLGDVIISTPVINAISGRYPGAEIFYLAESPYIEILGHHPGLAGTIALESGTGRLLKTAMSIRRMRFTAAVDLFYNPASAWLLLLSGIPVRIGGSRKWRKSFYTHTFAAPTDVRSAVAHHLSALAPIDCEAEERVPRVYLEEEEMEKGKKVVSALRGGAGGGRVVAVHAGGTWPSKRWPAGHFRRLTGIIGKQFGADALFLAGPGEDELASEAAGKAGEGAHILPSRGIRETASVMRACDAVIANDGGIMHLAVALGLPTVGIFGPTDPEIWFPYEGKGPFTVVNAGKPCSPCDLHECGDGSCLGDIEPEEVAYRVGIVTGWDR